MYCSHTDLLELTFHRSSLQQLCMYCSHTDFLELTFIGVAYSSYVLQPYRLFGINLLLGQLTVVMYCKPYRLLGITLLSGQLTVVMYVLQPYRLFGITLLSEQLTVVMYFGHTDFLELPFCRVSLQQLCTVSHSDFLELPFC